MSASITMLAPDRLSPNPWNPNRMTQDEFNELVAEVRHLGRLPKPIIVRANGKGYEIVDGEHGWGAAKVVGLAEIPCEVVEADDFESMRQTFKRNQHGTHSKVKLGQMWRRMLAEREGLSVRALAKEIEVSEGTIRNDILYADAFEVRNDYAREHGLRGDIEKSIDRLPVKEVRDFLGLPPSIGNAWLTAGKQKDIDLKAVLSDVSVVPWTAPPEWDREKYEHVDFYDVWQRQYDEEHKSVWHTIEEQGLWPAFFTEGYSYFDQAVRIAAQLHWMVGTGRRKFPRINEYAAAIAASGFYWNQHINRPQYVDLLRQIPARETENGTIEPIIEPEPWGALIRKAYTAAKEAKNIDVFHHVYKADLELRRRKVAGDGTLDLTDPRDALLMDDVRRAPDFVQESEWLTLGEKSNLADFTVAGWLERMQQLFRLESKIGKLTPFAEEILAVELPDDFDDHQAFRDIVYSVGLRRDRRAKLSESGDYPAAIRISTEFSDVVKDLVLTLARQRATAKREAFLDDRDAMIDALVEEAKETHTVREGTIDGRPAHEVLRERLGRLERPELRLLAVRFTDVSRFDWSWWASALHAKGPTLNDAEDSE